MIYFFPNSTQQACIKKYYVQILVLYIDKQNT